jgi:hypothetical protein
VTQHDDPVRVGRFEWERLMMMSVPHPQNLKLLPIGIFMSVDGGSARPGNTGLAMFGPHEKTWAKLLRWAVNEGWLLLVQRGGARRGPNGTTVVRASVYAASVPQLVWKRREEILGAPPFRADDSLKGAPEGSPEALKGAPDGSLIDEDSLNGAPMAPFNGADPSSKGASRDSLPNPLKGAPDGFEGSVSRFEGSAQTLPHHVVTSRTSTTTSAGPVTESSADGGGGGRQHDNEATLTAAAFLQDLPAPWTAGRRTAQTLAPLLLDIATAQGWPLDHQLAAKLTENAGGINNYPAVLRKRIEDLPKRPTAEQATTAPKCGECDEGGFRYHDPITQMRPYRCPCRTSNAA